MTAVRILAIVVLSMFAVTGIHAQTFRWAAQGDFQTLDPHSQNEILTNSINGQIYETLVKRDKALKISDGLATEWTQLSPTLWRFKLRQNVRFHDGGSFTADDVVFSVTRAQDANSAIRSYAIPMGIPRKVDSHTVEFQLPNFNPIFLEHASFVFIMSRAWSEKNAVLRPLDFKSKEDKYTASNANGTGPFVLVSRQVDARSVFRRYSNWWGRHEGNLQEVVFLPVKSDATRTAGLISGELDFVWDPSPQDVARLRNAPTKVLDGVENRALFIGMDQARDELLYSSVKGKNPFKDVRVRKALYHAVDIEAIRTKLMRGQSLPTGAINPSILGHYNDPEIERRLPFDLAKARSLMVEAGYQSGFEVQLDCPNNRYINDEEICVALAAMWAQIGVKIKLNVIPRAVFFAKGEKSDVSMYLLGWGGAVTDAETTITPILRGKGDGGNGSWNWGNMKNSKIEEWGAASSKEADPLKREQLIRAIFKEHNEQVHHIPLHRQVIPWAMRSNVEAVHRADNWLEWRWISVK